MNNRKREERILVSERSDSEKDKLRGRERESKSE